MLTMPIVCSAESRDGPALAALLGEVGYPATRAAAARRLDVLLRHDGSTVLVAVDDERVIGFGSLHVFPVLHEDAPRGQITALVVSQSFRNRGIGRMIVSGLEEVARANGVGRIVVATANHRADTHRFYENLGYEHIGRRYALLNPK